MTSLGLPCEVCHCYRECLVRGNRAIKPKHRNYKAQHPSNYECVVSPTKSGNGGISIPAPGYEQAAVLCPIWLHQGRLTPWRQQQQRKPQHLRTRLRKHPSQRPTEASLMVTWLPWQRQCIRSWRLWGRQKQKMSVLPRYETYLLDHHRKGNIPLPNARSKCWNSFVCNLREGPSGLHHQLPTRGVPATDCRMPTFSFSAWTIASASRLPHQVPYNNE
jgi:hypothetical protein